MDGKATLEFYGDALLEELLAAADIEKKKYESAADQIGKTLCKVMKRNQVEVAVLDGDGETIDQLTVYR